MSNQDRLAEIKRTRPPFIGVSDIQWLIAELEQAREEIKRKDEGFRQTERARVDAIGELRIVRTELERARQENQTIRDLRSANLAKLEETRAEVESLKHDLARARAPDPEDDDHYLDEGGNWH